MDDLIRTNEHIAMNRAFGTGELNKLLSAALERENKFTQKKSFAPSGLGYSGSCPRRWWYAFNGEDFIYDTTPTAMVNMQQGADAGERIAKLFEKAGILIDAEFEVLHDDPPIHGYIDAIVNWRGTEVLVETKTTKNSTWNHRLNSNSVPGYQLIQLLIYMYVTKHDRGFFYTENKDTNEVFVLPVKMTEEYKQLVEKTLEWMRVVKDNADNGELPKRPFTRSSMQCKGCEVKNKCWENWEKKNDPNPGTVDLPALELPK